MIQCTSCRYYCDGCPMSIRIPDIFRALNTARLYKKDDRPKIFYNNLIGQAPGKPAIASAVDNVRVYVRSICLSSNY